ncbi:MAG: 3'-5' exoribonuclease [Candidatus Brocadiaceae bacterium]|nr:3'-5' exoribonuclease [Candidatus Brocadiaceae bacterium]
MWIDTEFNEYKGALISLALVAEDGREWYGVRYCDDPGWWVREHVMPYLTQEPERDAVLRARLETFLAQFDAVHIISDWPGDIAHFCNLLEFAPGDRIGPDTMTFEVRRDLPDTATTSAIPHNALEDARALARVGHNVKVRGCAPGESEKEL